MNLIHWHSSLRSIIVHIDDKNSMVETFFPHERRKLFLNLSYLQVFLERRWSPLNSPVNRNYATGSILGKLSIEFWSEGRMVRNRKSARPGVTRIRRRKLFDVRTVYGSGVHNPSLDTIYRGDSVDKWPLVGHVHPQNRNARVPLIDRKPIFARQLSPNTKFSAEENRGGPSIDDSTPALERLNRGCNYSLPPVMPYFDFAWSRREQINSKRLNRFPTKRKCIPLQDYNEIVEIFVIIFLGNDNLN